MTIDLSIIIVNWNTKLMLAHCLRSVKDNLQDLQIETLVVDNGSTDGSTGMLRKDFPEVFLIENRENAGFAKASNQAIRLSQGTYILLLNSDAILQPDSVQKMIHVMGADRSIGIVGAGLVYPDGRSQASHGPLPNFWIEVRGLFGLDKLHSEKVDHQVYKETGWVSGACMLIRRSLLDQIGLLDEAFFMFNEEIDLCYRSHKVGTKVVYVQSAIVIHSEGGSTGQSVQRIMRLYSGKLLYFYKHFGPNAERRLKRMMVIATISKGLIYRMLRLLSLGSIHKDDFWWTVSKELNTLSK